MLEVKDLSITFRETEERVLNGISFSMRQGDTLVLMGPSGCGKTTLLRTIQGLLADEDIEKKGEVKLDKDIKVRTVFQEPRLLPWLTLEENIFFGVNAKSDFTKKRADSMLKKVHLSEHRKYLPMKVSLGMKQRANLARSLAGNPQLILFDEPFSALDIDIKKKIQEDLLVLIDKENISCLFVTHDIEEALFLKTRILIMSNKPTKILKEVDGSKINEIDLKDAYLSMVS